MKIKLSFKICAAFLSTFFVVLIIMVGSIQFFAYRNFSDYVHQVEIEMLDGYIDKLNDLHAKDESWESLKGGYWKWYQFLRPAKQKRDGVKTKTYPSSVANETDISDSGFVLRMAGRLTLFDTAKKPVAGRANTVENHTLVKLESNGKAVGWLGLRQHERLSHPLDVAYLKEQSKVFYFVAAAVLVFVTIVSFFLSQHLLAPIKRLTAGTRALTSFLFDTRIDVPTKDELGQLAKDFNMLAVTLQQSETMRQQWITDVSHELRTPLSIIRGEIEAMLDGIRHADEQSLGSVHAEVVYLNKIVNDLHDLSLAETGHLPLKLESVNPIEVLRKTITLFKSRFTDHHVTIEDNLGSQHVMTLQADEGRLTQLFSNVFENALRYMDKPGSLKLWQKRRPDAWTLSIEDSGPGVPEESVGRLFDRFYRVDFARSRARGGSGLGLSICKKIVELHGGKITAGNTENGGLRFDMVLPAVSGSA